VELLFSNVDLCIVTIESSAEMAPPKRDAKLLVKVDSKMLTAPLKILKAAPEVLEVQSVKVVRDI